MDALSAIYSCKMFKTHKNKEKIVAALQDPINSELVQQLSDYLSDEVREQATNADDPTEAPADVVEEDTTDTEDTSSDETTLDDSVESDEGVDTESEDDSAVDEDTDDSSTEDAESATVEESTRIGNSMIASATTLYNSESGTRVFSLSSVVEVLKGSLNNMQDTAGVSTIHIKDNEMWIYYDDSINLNSRMVPVIDFVNAGNYTYLKFNRLARSDNAIVLEINTASIDATIEPLPSGDTDE